jgi:sugar lactone lactonase YvrE
MEHTTHGGTSRRRVGALAAGVGLAAAFSLIGRAQDAPRPPGTGATVAASERVGANTDLPRAMGRGADDLEIVHRFTGQMPVGVAVTATGRAFVSYPRWEDKLEYTLAVLENGREVPFPRDGAYQKGNENDPANNLVSLQGLIVDGRDRLWVLDTGTVNMEPVQPFTPKLICFNARTGAKEWEHKFSAREVPPGGYLNDLRIDLTRGAEGFVYITDSGKSPGIVVVDVANHRAWRRLTNHPTTKAEPGFVGFVEGRALYKDTPDQPPQHVSIGSDGIAISPDGKRLYYTPLASRKLYSVSTDALADPKRSDRDTANTVVDHGGKGAADGMGEDQSGNVYTTNWEQNAVLRRLPDGTFETVVADPRLLWPDTIDLAPDGYLYVISNQLHRQGGYNNGRDLRVKPYLLTRIKTNARSVRRVKETTSARNGGTPE